jgi:DNA polymerase
MNKGHLDFESRSTVDLKKVGAHAYARHPSTEITCATLYEPIHERKYKFRRNEIHLLAKFPNIGRLIIGAHNAPFEAAMWEHIMVPRFGAPARNSPSLWRCTMARAAMVGLPLGLDELTRVLRCHVKKDLDGRAIMLRLSKPLAYDVLGDPVYDDDHKKYERLYAYNETDVDAEMEVDSLLPELPESEQRIWELDFVMNRRGFQVDLALAAKGAEMSDALMGPINARVKQLTNNVIDKATQNKALIAWLESRGVAAPTKEEFDPKLKKTVEKKTLDKIGVTELLERPDLPVDVRSVVLLKRQASKRTSTAKFAKALEMACADGRVRGGLQYSAAHTGRWGGRLLQPHNIPQGYGADPDAATGLEMHEQDLALACVMSGNPELMTFTYGDKAMEALSDVLRAMIVSGPQKTLLSADYNAIEARIVFWLAGQEDALASYRKGGSPYLDMGAYIYRRPITKKGDPREYDIAKRTVLGSGFGQGWKTYQSTIYTETAKKGKPLRISDELAKTAVNGYREKYAYVPRAWKETEAAAISAVKNPGQRYTSCGGRVLWSMSNDRRFLVARLPSGRYLWYYKPTVKMAVTPWGAEKITLFYWGTNPDTKEWEELKTYGGALFENLVQATARDIMAHGMLNAEAAGYEMILTVHDELLAEVNIPEDAAYRLDHFMKLMCALPPWADGLPVAAEGWTANRYRK